MDRLRGCGRKHRPARRRPRKYARGRSFSGYLSGRRRRCSCTRCIRTARCCSPPRFHRSCGFYPLPRCHLEKRSVRAFHALEDIQIHRREDHQRGDEKGKRGIYLPRVLPYFRAAVSVALGLCWKAGTAAEVIALSGGTIGERLYTAKVYFETPNLFAWTAVIVLLSAGLEKLFLLAVDKMAERMGA